MEVRHRGEHTNRNRDRETYQEGSCWGVQGYRGEGGIHRGDER